MSWIDSANTLWLFGGGAGGAFFNDLWKFNPTTKQWTWTSDSNTPDQIGTYGTKGVPAAGNVPGARWGAAAWIDDTNTL